MHVSVVVCTYNRAVSLGRTLEALAGQATPPALAWELVVVDNNSVDATRTLVEAFAATSPMPVRYCFEARQGLSHARNTGIDAARGRIIAFTDDDVRPDPEWVASIVAAMSEADADVLGGRILPQWSQPPPRWLEDRPLLRAHLAIMEHDEPATLPTASRRGAVWGANMALRREVFESIGGFDVNRGIRGAKLYRDEDRHLVDRAIAAGYRVVYEPRVRVWHRIGADRIRLGYFARLYFDRAEGKALSQGAPPGRLLLGAPLASYRRVARGLWLWVRALSRRHPDRLDHWLGLCEALGLVWGFWKLHIRRTGPATIARTGTPSSR